MNTRVVAKVFEINSKLAWSPLAELPTTLVTHVNDVLGCSTNNIRCCWTSW